MCLWIERGWTRQRRPLWVLCTCIATCLNTRYQENDSTQLCVISIAVWNLPDKLGHVHCVCKCTVIQPEWQVKGPSVSINGLSVWLVWSILSLCVSRASSCASVNDELVCFQGDRGPKGVCGGDGPKGGKVGLRQTEKMWCGRSKRRRNKHEWRIFIVIISHPRWSWQRGFLFCPNNEQRNRSMLTFHYQLVVCDAGYCIHVLWLYVKL